MYRTYREAFSYVRSHVPAIAASPVPPALRGPGGAWQKISGHTGVFGILPLWFCRQHALCAPGKGGRRAGAAELQAASGLKYWARQVRICSNYSVPRMEPIRPFREAFSTRQTCSIRVVLGLWSPYPMIVICLRFRGL